MEQCLNSFRQIDIAAMHISIMDLQGKEQGNRSCDHQSARKIMPVFPIEFTAQTTIHQRQIIQDEADSLEDAFDAVQSYDIDKRKAPDLGQKLGKASGGTKIVSKYRLRWAKIH